jgi:hypothetical protein
VPNKPTNSDLAALLEPFQALTDLVTGKVFDGPEEVSHPAPEVNPDPQEVTDDESDEPAEQPKPKPNTRARVEKVLTPVRGKRNRVQEREQQRAESAADSEEGAGEAEEG